MLTRAPLRLLPLLAVLLASACGGDDKNDDDDNRDPALAIAIAPSTVTLAQGASTTVAVSLTRTNLSSTNIALSVSGAPTGVTATIDPASTTADTATVTITAAQNATVGTATITVTAAADGGPSSSSTIALTITLPAPITVSATLTNYNGIPRGSAIVHVWGNGATAPVDTTTAADGTFTVQNIAPPYDIVFNIPGYGSRAYLGMTTTSGQLGELLDVDAPGTEVMVSGIFTSSGIDEDARTIVTLNTATYGSQSNSNPGEDDFDIPVIGPPGASSVNATIAALHYKRDGNDLPTEYVSFGSLATVLSLPVPAAQNLPLIGPIASRNLSIRARNADNAPANSVAVAWRSGRVAAQIVSTTLSTDTISLLVPTDARVPLFTQVIAGAGKIATLSVRPIGATETALDVQMPRGLQQVTPQDAAINVTDAVDLSAEAVPNATYLFSIGFGGNVTRIITASNVVSLARLRQLGIGLASSTSYQYAVYAITGGSADPFAANRLLTTDFVQVASDARIAQAYTFATQ